MCKGITATAPTAQAPPVRPITSSAPTAAAASTSNRATALDTVTISPQAQQAAKAS